VLVALITGNEVVETGFSANMERTSSPSDATNTDADPPKFNAEPELLLCLTVRERVVPEAVYVPSPVSQPEPSSIT